MNTIKIDKKKDVKLAEALGFLVNGLSKDERRKALNCLNVEEFAGVVYAVATNGALALWCDITEHPIEEGVYAVESTKTSYFLTKEDIMYPNWKQLCLCSNRIADEVDKPEWVNKVLLGPETAGHLSALAGKLSSGKLFAFSGEQIALIHKGSRKEDWEVVHITEDGGPVRLKSANGKSAMIMPISVSKRSK